MKIRHRPPQGTIRVINPARDDAVVKRLDKLISASEDVRKSEDPELLELSNAYDDRDMETVRRLLPKVKKRYGNRLYFLLTGKKPRGKRDY